MFAQITPGLEHIAFDLCQDGHANTRVVSFAEAILPLLATRTAPPFDPDYLKAPVPQLELVDRGTDDNSGNALTTEVLEHEIEQVRGVILGELGKHRACFDDAWLLLAAPAQEPSHSNWHANFCVRAFAVSLWSMRSVVFKKAFSQFERGTAPPERRASLSDLRRDLMSSYHYGMRMIALRRAELKAGVSPGNWSVIDMTFDPWLTPGRSLSALGLQYLAAPDIDDYFCDEGAAVADYAHAIKRMWEWLLQGKKEGFPEDGPA